MKIPCGPFIHLVDLSYPAQHCSFTPKEQSKGKRNEQERDNKKGKKQYQQRKPRRENIIQLRYHLSPFLFSPYCLLYTAPH